MTEPSLNSDLPKNPSKTKKIFPILFNIGDTKYSVVKYVGKKLLKWKITKKIEDPWDVMWTDSAVTPDQFDKLKLFQKINHFPGMYSLARKNHLANNLMKMRKKFPNYYKFFPKTFLLPADYGDFRNQYYQKKNQKTYIVKPEADCQGRGIYLTRSYENVGSMDHVIVQQYILKPYLIDELKFDLRIYVLLAGCDPLRIYIYQEGLARFATEKYRLPRDLNLDNLYMHLTNYAINKKNPNFKFSKNTEEIDTGHKRKLTTVFDLLAEKGIDIEKLKEDIEKIIIKMFCSVQPILAHNYHSCQPKSYGNDMCFEILGLDIILDEKGKPWLLEVNHTPSFNTDTPIDKEVKRNLIKDALILMNISKNNKIKHLIREKKEFKARTYFKNNLKETLEEKKQKSEIEQIKRDQFEMNHNGGFKKIYPVENPTEPYLEFIEHAKNLWETATGTKKKVETKIENKNISENNKNIKIINTSRAQSQNSNTFSKNSTQISSKIISSYSVRAVKETMFRIGKSKNISNIVSEDTKRNTGIFLKTKIVDFGKFGNFNNGKQNYFA